MRLLNAHHPHGARDPRSKVRIAAPVLFGGMYVTPIVTQFVARYPEWNPKQDGAPRTIRLPTPMTLH